jgi:hypothetical protein
MYDFVNGVGRVKGSGNYVKIRVEGDKSTGEVRGDIGGRAHYEVISKSKELESEKLDKVKEVRVLPNDITSVHWLIVQVSLFFLLYAFIISEVLPRFSSGIHLLLADEYPIHDTR